MKARSVGGRTELRGDRAAVELVPGLGDQPVGDPEDRGRGEFDPAGGRREAEELAAVRPGRTLPPTVGPTLIVSGRLVNPRKLEQNRWLEGDRSRPRDLDQVSSN